MFSDVDRSRDPTAAVAYLNAAAEILAPVKAELLNLLDPEVGSLVLDVGCGAGHDLVNLARRGAVPVGVDLSVRMTNESRKRCATDGVGAAAVVGDGAALPFAPDCFDAARIERVLQHAGEPRRVLHEVHRVVRRGARVVIFEPDWGSLAFDDPYSTIGDAVALGAMLGVTHPRIGLELRRFLLDVGFRIDELRVDPAYCPTLDDVQSFLALDVVMERAGVTQADAHAWLQAMRERSDEGTFWATMNRTIAVAIG